MAIEHTLIAKIGGGMVAVGGTAGAGFYAHSQGLFGSKNTTFEDETKNNYLIVKTTAHTSNVEGEIYEHAFLSSKKNFYCSVTIDTTSEKDEECEIYKLSDKEKNLAKAITKNDFVTTKNIKEEGNYLKITSPKLMKLINTWDDSTKQLIDIVKTNKETEKFAKLIPIYKVENGEIVDRKTSFLYAQVTSAGTSVQQPSESISENTKNYQCQLATTKFDCSIVQLTLSEDKVINVPSTTTLVSTDLKVNEKHFQIKMQEKYLKQISFTDNQTIDVISTKDNDAGKHYAKLTPLFHTIDREIYGQDNYFLSVSTSENVTGTTKNGYKKCQIGNKTKQINCEIYKFDSEQEHDANVSFKNTITKTEANTDIKQNKLFVIKISNIDMDINNLKTDTEITLSNETSTDPKYKLTIKNRLFLVSTTTNNKVTAKSVHLLNI